MYYINLLYSLYMFMFQTAGAKHSTSPWVQVSAPRKRRSPICCTAMWWSSVSLCLVWIRTASERRWTCQISSNFVGGKRYHLKVVCVILFVSLRKDVTMFSLVSTNCFTENWWRLLRIILYPFFACFKDLEAGPDRSRHTPRSGWSWPQVLAQVDQNKEILPLSSDGATVLMEPGRRVSRFRFDMILHQKTLWRRETMRTIEQGFKIEL